LLCGAALVALGLYGARLIWHGFSTADQPSYLEMVVARAARNLAIPRKARLGVNPWEGAPDVLNEADRLQYEIGYFMGTEIVPIPATAGAIEKSFDDFCNFQPGSLNIAHADSLSSFGKTEM